MGLLCISNGHGEDVIAVKVLKALQMLAPEVSIKALPIVGEGHAYHQADIEILGPTQTMPSGGFIYMERKQLARDLQGGLVQLTWAQIQAVRQWADPTGRELSETGAIKVPSDGAANLGESPQAILAVGDIVPLIFGWLSGVSYGFIGTAKSDYYLRDEQGPHQRSGFWAQMESRSASVYHPWERWLMQRPRCQGVFPRDTITARQLQRWKIPAFDLGNPMMDGFVVSPDPIASVQTVRTILLLPGSRAPEAYENWQIILQAVETVIGQLAPEPVTFLAAVAPSLELDILGQQLQARGWTLSEPVEGAAMGFCKQSAQLQLSSSSFIDYSHQSQVAIAMAGTATEQFVGLGKPVITLPGPGPQFNPAFAEAQTRLLGESIILVAQPDAVGVTLSHLMADAKRLQRIHKNGLCRMGTVGAATRIAEILLKELLTQKR